MNSNTVQLSFQHNTHMRPERVQDMPRVGARRIWNGCETCLERVRDAPGKCARHVQNVCVRHVQNACGMCPERVQDA